jgi:hypothetical protein
MVSKSLGLPLYRCGASGHFYRHNHPPGFPFTITSTSGISGDIYTTKDNSGVLLILPVLHIGDIEEIVWGLGDIFSIFSIRFSIPGFPKLPSFHIPVVLPNHCIAVWIVC